MLGEDPHQAAVAQAVADQKGRLIDDPLTGESRSQEGVAVIGTQVSRNRNDRLSLAAEDPAAGAESRRQRVAKTIMSREIVRRRGIPWLSR